MCTYLLLSRAVNFSLLAGPNLSEQKPNQTNKRLFRSYIAQRQQQNLGSCYFELFCNGLSSIMTRTVATHPRSRTLHLRLLHGSSWTKLASFPGRFVGEGKTAWSTLLTHARYSPQKQGNSCTFENPPLNSNVILRCMFAYHPFPSRETLRYSRLLYYRLVLHCTVLYYTTSMEWSGEFL